MPWLSDALPSILETVVRTALIFLGAVVMLRLARRRTIARWTVTDVVTAVSVETVRYVLFERQGGLTVVPDSDAGSGPQQLRE